MAKLQWKARLSRLVGNCNIGNNWFPKYARDYEIAQGTPFLKALKLEGNSIFFHSKKECAVFCTRWELGAIFTILFLHYLPTSSSVRPGKTGLDFLSKNTRVEKSARDSCNKKLSILSLKRKTNKYITLLFFFLSKFFQLLKKRCCVIVVSDTAKAARISEVQHKRIIFV